MTQRRVQRILVVDDQADVARSMAMLLELLGFQARSARNGGDALESAHSFRPDAVLLDIGLPDMDGHEVARQLREQQSDVMLVALTGYNPQTGKDQGGCFDHYLVKPVDLDTLQALLGEQNLPGG